MASLRADLTYQRGLARMWSRQTRLDMFMPVFANLGEQAVLNKEIFVGTDGELNDETFGFQEHWADYRYYSSIISGQFRSNYTETLDAWHLSQNFLNVPVLGDSFIEETVPMGRIMKLTGDQIEGNVPHIIYDSVVSIKHARALPTYSTPGLRRF